MKKRTLIVAALLAAMTVGANAQENLALNKEATASSNSTAAGESIDGNTGTRWEQNGESAGDVTKGDSFWYSVNLGESKAFNTIQIVWENDNVKQFEIQTSTDGNTWSTVYTSPEETGYGNVTKTYQIGDQEAQYVKIKATELNGQNYFSFWEFRVFNASEQTLTKVDAPAFVKKGEEFTVKALDAFGSEMTIGSISATNATQVEGKANTFTANADGKVEVTVTNGDVTKTATIWAVSSSAAKPTLKATDLSFFDESLDGLTEYKKDWEGGYESSSVMDLGGNNVINVSQVVTYGFLKATEETGYKTLEFDIYPTEDVTNGKVVYQSTGLVDLDMPELKAGQWNHVSLDVEGATKYSDYIKFKFYATDIAHANSTLSILLDNVYLVKGNGEKVSISSKPNARGFYTIKGSGTAEEVNKLMTDNAITAYDLTGLTLEGTEHTLTPANPNALIYVKAADGKDGNNFEPAQDWGETKNLVGYGSSSSDQWYRPTTDGINLVDGYAVYQGVEGQGVRFISADANRSVNYTREIPAGKFVSTYLYKEAEVPTGCTAYKFVAGKDANTLDLEVVSTLEKETPYVIYNGTDANVNLACTGGTGDLAFTNEATATLGNVTVKGNYSYFVGDGTQYVLDATSYNATTGVLTLKKCTEKTNIVPFRVYFTLSDETKASVVKFMLPGTVTGINDVKANAQKAADVYSIDGRLVKKAATSVEGLASGVYIMNGKKYVVK